MSAPTLIIIPAFNEEEALPAVLDELRATHPDLHILVVDDGSVDATSDIAQRAGVAIATLPFNLGVGGALRTGFRYALRHGYDRAIQLDADGQHDPGEIGSLLEALDGGAELAIGSRFRAAETSYHVGWTRGSAMWVLRQLVSALSGQSVTDTSSGFRAFSRPTLELFARSYPVEYLGDTVEALLLASYAGLAVVEVPVQMRRRTGGEASTHSLRLAYHYLRLLATVAITAAPRRRRF